MVQVGVDVEHTSFGGVGAVAVLALAERVLDALLTAGFRADDARRAITAVANIAQSAAQNVQTSVRDFHRAETLAALDKASDAEYPALRRVLETAESPDDGQFDFELDLAITGLERLVRTPGQGPGASVALPVR
jgi:hypothetical protein